MASNMSSSCTSASILNSADVSVVCLLMSLVEAKFLYCSMSFRGGGFATIEDHGIMASKSNLKAHGLKEHLAVRKVRMPDQAV